MSKIEEMARITRVVKCTSIPGYGFAVGATHDLAHIWVYAIRYEPGSQDPIFGHRIMLPELGSVELSEILYACHQSLKALMDDQIRQNLRCQGVRVHEVKYFET